jgi:hypothetical protein
MGDQRQADLVPTFTYEQLSGYTAPLALRYEETITEFQTSIRKHKSLRITFAQGRDIRASHDSVSSKRDDGDDENGGSDPHADSRSSASVSFSSRIIQQFITPIAATFHEAGQGAERASQSSHCSSPRYMPRGSPTMLESTGGNHGSRSQDRKYQLCETTGTENEYHPRSPEGIIQQPKPCSNRMCPGCQCPNFLEPVPANWNLTLCDTCQGVCKNCVDKGEELLRMGRIPYLPCAHETHIRQEFHMPWPRNKFRCRVKLDA